jgi:UDP-N-acetylmuramyl pentapeptide phosphotransferase/UDP-N-acetylglucosamine-1-phosphate transferase
LEPVVPVELTLSKEVATAAVQYLTQSLLWAVVAPVVIIKTVIVAVQVAVRDKSAPEH